MSREVRFEAGASMTAAAGRIAAAKEDARREDAARQQYRDAVALRWLQSRPGTVRELAERMRVPGTILLIDPAERTLDGLVERGIVLRHRGSGLHLLLEEHWSLDELAALGWPVEPRHAHDPAAHPQEYPMTTTRLSERCLQALRALPDPYTTSAGWMRSAGIPKGSYGGLASELEGRGLIRAVGEFGARVWVLTEPGRDLLAAAVPDPLPTALVVPASEGPGPADAGPPTGDYAWAEQTRDPSHILIWPIRLGGAKTGRWECIGGQGGHLGGDGATGATPIQILDYVSKEMGVELYLKATLALEDARAAVDRLPCSRAPDLGSLAERIDYAARAWASEREEANHLAKLLDEAHTALDEIGAPRPGAPAERIRRHFTACVEDTDNAAGELVGERLLDDADAILKALGLPTDLTLDEAIKAAASIRERHAGARRAAQTLGRLLGKAPDSREIEQDATNVADLVDDLCGLLGGRGLHAAIGAAKEYSPALEAERAQVAKLRREVVDLHARPKSAEVDEEARKALRAAQAEAATLRDAVAALREQIAQLYSGADLAGALGRELGEPDDLRLRVAFLEGWQERQREIDSLNHH